MRDFLLLVRTEGDHLADLSPDQQQEHVRKIGGYIQGLVSANQLKGAQPLEMGGVVVHGRTGAIKDGPFVETKEVIVGYFLIQADSLASAIAIAKQNPVFDGGDASIEVRPIKRMDGIN